MIDKSLMKLLNGYYFKGFFGPFFVIVFPILLLFVLINAVVTGANGVPLSPQEVKHVIPTMIAGVMITSCMSIGFFNLPITIIEFKKSTLMKRIGAAKISKTSFLLTVFLYQFFWLVFTIIWLLLWGYIIGIGKPGVSTSDFFPSKIWSSLPFILLSFSVTIGIGLVLLSVFNTSQAIMGISNVIYLPISFLSGSFLPKTQIDGSNTLNIISYFLPTKYAVDPFFKVWNNGLSGLESMGWQGWAFPIIAIAFVIFCIIFASKKFNWGT